MSIVFMPRTQSISLRRSLVGGSHHRASTYWGQGLAMLGELHRGAHYRRGARVMNWKSWEYWKSYNWTWELLHPVSRWALLCLSLSSGGGRSMLTTAHRTWSSLLLSALATGRGC
jgi:hypothetical protein